MRLIDADAFLEDNKEFADREIEHPRYQETVRELIDEAPSINIVRCKECKKDGTRNCPYKMAKFGLTDEDFCSCGERENR